MAQPRTVFIHPVDNYLGKSLVPAFLVRREYKAKLHPA